MKLLIVDDNAVNLRVLRAQLETERHDVVAAANGVQALKALERGGYDGLISDILMPEMDGFRLCYEIRRCDELKTLPVVLYTATYTSAGDRALAQEVGADAYVAKPASTADLIAALRSATSAGDKPRQANPLPSESHVLKRYSGALVRKLEQKNVELGDAHEQLRDLLENSHDLIQSLTPDGAFIYVNRAWRELLGYGAAELGELRIFDIVAAGSRNAWAQIFERLLRGQPAYSFELQLRAKDGRNVPVEGSATAKMTNGKLAAIRCTWRDVSERMATAAAHQRLAAIVDSSADAIIGLDLDGVVTSWNASAERIFGYFAAEMLGVPMIRLIPDERKCEEPAIMSQLRRGERVEHFETIRLRKDGRRIHVSLTISPVLDASGVLVGVSKIVRDVTLHKAAEAARRASDERLAGVVNTSMDAIITIDSEHRISQFNPAAERLFGRAQDEAIGAPLSSLLPPRFREAHERHVAEFARTGVTSRQMGALLELAGLRSDGSEFPVEVSISQMEMADGHYYTAILRDITERRKHEESIARLSRIQAVLSGINAAIVRIRLPQALFDEACRIAFEEGGFGVAWIGTYDAATGDVTPVAWRGLEVESARVLASSRSDRPEGLGLVGRAIRDRKPAFTNDLVADKTAGGPRRAAALAQGFHSAIALPLLLDDQVTGVFTLFAKARNFFSDEELKLLLEVAGDISFGLSYMAKEARANYLAYYDVLTGLPNRTLFIDRLAQALRSAAPGQGGVAVVVGDVDRFRQINEVYGRQGGDALLREIAARVRPLSPNPENSARIGADEFAAIVTGVQSPADIAHIVERSASAVSQSAFSMEGGEIHITMSAGVAISPSDGANADALLGNAEIALRNAKRSGERFTFFQSEMTAHIAETLALENKLRRALALNQFELYYQPEVGSRSRRVVAFEALLRWNDPDSGVIAPAVFIEILETTGMIVEVGEWVIRSALAQLRAWRAEGVDTPRIAVNLSPRQLRHENFLDAVTTVLAEFGDEAHSLDFEITEGMVMSDFDAAAAKLVALRQLGAGIAIDDFGTGYSSLAYLGRLPMTALKIDRSFVSSMTTAADSMMIVSTIISLGRSMNLKVIAEGVETEEQAKYLQLLNCDQLQGYYFSRPLPAAQAREFLIANRMGK